MKWEYFLDVSYYDLWAVRPIGVMDFNSQQLFHVMSMEEASILCAILNNYQLKLEKSEYEK